MRKESVSSNAWAMDFSLVTDNIPPTSFATDNSKLL